jgi:hypothetical protein
MSETPRQVWPSRYPRLTICVVILPFVLLGGCWQDLKPNLTPLQDYYLARYVRSSFTGELGMKNRDSLVYLITAKHQAYPAFPEDVFPNPNIKNDVPFVLTRRAFEQGSIRVSEYPVKAVTPRQLTTAREYHEFLSHFFFDHRSVLSLYRWPLGYLLCLWSVFIPLGIRADWKLHQKARFGVKLRGPDLVSRRQFNRKVRGDGLEFILSK